MSDHKTVERLERKIRRLEKELVTDQLTGVLNRRGFFERARPFLKEVAQRSKFPQRRSVVIENFSVIFVDIDHFKKINDTYGHATGDAALAYTAQLLRKHVREIDLVGRYGGEELVIGLVGANVSEASQVAENLRSQLASSPLKHHNHLVSITASFGVADYQGEPALEELLHRADEALYKAKKQGRNRVVSN